MSPSGVQIAFYYLAAAAVTSATVAVTRANPVHSILWVLSLFLHVAGLFLLTGAEFLAAVQIIVYAGAILVFYLFFIMLLDLRAETSGPRFGAHWPLCVAAGIAFAGLIWYAHDKGGIAAAPRTNGGSATPGNLSTIGTALFTEFALPFEIVSLVLLAAIVGAVVIGRKRWEAR
jgi:NADH-quinone oxidoreductase subunit J